MNIQYIDQGHTYTIDGKQVPSVTQVLKTLESYDGYPEGAALRGTYAHQAIEWYEAGTLDLETLDPALAPYLTAWIAFRQENPLQIDIDTLQWETIVGSRLGYAGRVDLMSDAWIIDIKTGAPTKTHPHQLEAYNRAAIETIGGKRRQTANLYLAADESYRVIVRNKKKDEAATVWNQFQAALTVHNFKNGGKAE